MSRYYIYCSNNQAYHALINNSIMAKSIMREDFRNDTASYISKDYLFVTKLGLPYETRYTGIAESYYAVTLEIDDANTDSVIPAIFVTLSGNGEIVLTEKKCLNEFDAIENCIGAFVCGEIPITYLSGIIFENEEQKNSFKKSSTDLWFPEELHKVCNNVEVNETITIEILKKAAESVDTVLTEEEALLVRQCVLNRCRVKAALYYAIDATNDWNIGAVRGNVDSTILRFLDKNGELDKLVRKAFKNISKTGELSYEQYISVVDAVLEGEEENTNKNFFKIIVSTLLEKTNIRSRILEDTINVIGQNCIDIAGDERVEVVTALNIVIKYLSSNMDPDEAMTLIGKYDVLRALMVFLDQPKNADFLKRAATKLRQTERRYAYIMYGILNGMSEVERNQKSIRALEFRLEEKVLELFPNMQLINDVIASTAFMEGAQVARDAAFGIVPNINIWFDCATSQALLLKSEDGKLLEKVYLAMTKISKDDPIPEQDIYAFQEPVIISVRVGEDILETYPIYRKKDAKEFGKKIEKVLKTRKEVFSVEGFKKYLAEENRYQKFYKKNSDMVQELCRKVK